MTEPTKKPPRDNPLMEAALAYAKLGYTVFPCYPRTKRPRIRGGKGFKGATTNPEKIREWWGIDAQSNIGLVPGSAGHIVIDVDGEEGRANAERLGLLPLTTRAVVTRRGFHLYFVHPGGKIGNGKLGVGLDVRADGGYVMAPPSIHPSGGEYAWVDESAPILPLPKHIAKMLLGGKGDGIGAAGIEREGGRNHALASHLGGLRRKGMEEPELIAAALEFNRTHCDPPLSDREARSVAKSIAKYPPAFASLEEALDTLNREYAVIQIGGKARILREHDGDIDFLGVSDFRLLLQNRFVIVRDKLRPVADRWLADPKRRQFAKLVFVPGVSSIPDAFNLWRGWGVEPKAGDCSLFLAHVRDNVCKGDENLFRWNVAWFADIVQNPRSKPGTSVVYRGRQGTGKTITGNIVGKLFGHSYKHVASARRVTGQFNPHLGECLLLHADEAFWAGDKSGEGALKDLITSNVQWIERKGIDAVEVPNYVRLLVTSNSDWVVPAGLEERRFCVIDVGESHMQDKAYFKAIMQQMESGGYEALLQYLMDFPLDGIDLRTIPQTSALAEQKIASLPPESAWWLDTLARGALWGDRDGAGLVAKKRLYADFVRHAERVGVRRKSIETAVGIFLKKHVKGLKTPYVRLDDDPRPVPCYQFPPLRKCREVFGRTIRHFEWEEPWEWQPDSASTEGDPSAGW